MYLKTSPVFYRCGKGNSELLFHPFSITGENEEAQFRAAYICDEMTWQDFHHCSDSIFLHPKIWKKQMSRFHPSILFCESAWSGIDPFRNVWRGRIYRDRRVPFENRDILLDILEYCRQNRIITVFWNKEDPVYFDHDIYDFTDTAMRFDHIFTTAAECIVRYQQMGHKSVHLLPFGVNTAMFHPATEKQRANSALFAGSWFGDHIKRCKELEALLDYALAQGWKLDIYDRNSGSPEKRFQFPKKYAAYLHPAVPFTKMPEIYRQYKYAINVNTVVESSTMISRRVLQLAACGVTIVSNESMGFEALKDCLEIWRESPSGPVFAVGIPQAIAAHSTENQFRHIQEVVMAVSPEQSPAPL